MGLAFVSIVPGMLSSICKSKLVRSAGIYTISNLFNSAIPFLIMPVLTRYLTPTDYGLTATFQILVGFVAPFVGLSIQGAVARKYYDKDSVDFPAYVANCLIILFASSLVTGLLIMGLGPFIGRMAVFPDTWIWAVLSVSFCQFVTQITLTLWQVRSMSLKYGMFQTAQLLATLVLTLWFVVGLGMNWQGVVWAQVITGILSCATGLTLMWRSGLLKFKLHQEYITSAMKFGLPLIPHVFGGWLMTATDRIFINNLVGVAESGIYTVGFQISMVIGLIEVSFNNAWVPWLYERLKQRDHRTDLKIVKFTYCYVAGMIALALLLSLLSPWFIGYFVGKEFRNAGMFIFWLAMARAVEAMYYMTCNYIFYSAETKLIALATFSTATIHVTATYLLVRMNGAVGAAQATFISSVLLVALVWFLAARIIKMPWRLEEAL